MMQIFFEERVIRRHARNAELTRDPHAGVMRDERRMDVDDIERFAAEPRANAAQGASLHQAVLRVERDAVRGNSDDAGFVGGNRFRIGRRDQSDFVAESGQLTAKRADGSRYSVDPRKVDV